MHDHAHVLRLLAARSDAARAAGEAPVWLDGLNTHPAARRFHERHAFQIVGELSVATDLGEQGMWVDRHG